MTASVGHNGGPLLEGRRMTVRTTWAKALFADPETPTYVMAMGWVIHWYSDRDGKGAALSNEQFMAICNLSRPTVTKGKAWLVDHGYIHIKLGDGRGLKSTFALALPSGAKEETALPHAEEASFPETTFPETTKHETPLQKGETSLQKGETALPPIQEYNQEYKPSSAPARAHETGRAFWAKATNPHGYNPDADVVFEDGALTLVNGLRSKWLTEFSDDAHRLDLALTEIAGNLQINSSRSLRAQVESRLARLAGEKLDKDNRYKSVAAANNRGGKKNASEDDRFESLVKNI